LAACGDAAKPERALTEEEATALITGTTALMSELLNDSTIVPVVNSSGDPEFECPREGGGGGVRILWR